MACRVAAGSSDPARPGRLGWRFRDVPFEGSRSAQWPTSPATPRHSPTPSRTSSPRGTTAAGCALSASRTSGTTFSRSAPAWATTPPTGPTWASTSPRPRPTRHAWPCCGSASRPTTVSRSRSWRCRSTAPPSTPAVVAYNVLEHIPDDVSALKSFAGLLRPGGRVVLIVPAFPFAMSAFDREIGHQRRYRRQVLSDRLRDAGLDVEVCRHINGPGLLAWFVTCRLLRGRPREGAMLTAYGSSRPARAKAGGASDDAVRSVAVRRRPGAGRLTVRPQWLPCRRPRGPPCSDEILAMARSAVGSC